MEDEYTSQHSVQEYVAEAMRRPFHQISGAGVCVILRLSSWPNPESIPLASARNKRLYLKQTNGNISQATHTPTRFSTYRPPKQLPSQFSIYTISVQMRKPLTCWESDETQRCGAAAARVQAGVRARGSSSGGRKKASTCHQVVTRLQWNASVE